MDQIHWEPEFYEPEVETIYLDEADKRYRDPLDLTLRQAAKVASYNQRKTALTQDSPA